MPEYLISENLFEGPGYSMRLNVASISMILLVIASLLMTGVHGASVVNQLKNGSFESWTTQTSPNTNQTVPVPSNWTLEVGVVAQSTFATDGNYSVELRALPNLVGGHFSRIAQTIPASSLDTPIVPGAYYEFSFDAAGIYFNKGMGNATVTWTGALGNTLRVDTIAIPDSTNVGYQHFDARLQAPVSASPADAATSATIRFLVDGQSSAENVNLWVDHASFGPSSPV
ncbi:MAG: hypothetical protein ACYDDF_07530 [Thermoplasmatota archaeon]